MIDIDASILSLGDRRASIALEPARVFVEAAAKRFPIKRAILFGSRARGHSRPDSDMDVALILAGQPGSFVETKLALADLAFDMMLETGVLIQPLPIWESEWETPETHANPDLVRNIWREGLAI